MMTLLAEKDHTQGRVLTKTLTAFPFKYNPRQIHCHGVLKEETLLIKSLINSIHNEPKFSPFTKF